MQFPWTKYRLQVESLRKMLQDGHEYRSEQLRIRNQMDFPLGSRVCCTANYPCELLVGEVVGYQEICLSRQVVPVYKDFKTGKEHLGLNIKHSNPTYERVLSALPWWERYSVFHPGHEITEAAAAHLERYGTFAPENVSNKDTEYIWPEEWQQYSGRRAYQP